MATVKVKSDGKAPSGLKAGDNVVTGGGTYKITGVNSDGSYKSEKINNETTSTYKGSYDSPGGGTGSASAGYSRSGGSKSSGGKNTSPTVSNGISALAATASTMASRGGGSGGGGGGYGNGKTVKVGSDGKAPPGLSVGTDVVTGGGTYRIMGINADGTYRSQKINNVTTGTYSGIYDNMPYGGAQGLNLWASGGINGSDGQGGFAFVGNGPSAFDTNYFIDANGHKYPGNLWALQPDGSIKNTINDEVRTYYPGDDRTGKTSLFYGASKAYGPDGEMAIFSSADEKDFAENAPVGASMRMNGATYTKNEDGGVTVRTDDGKIFQKYANDDGTWDERPDSVIHLEGSGWGRSEHPIGGSSQQVSGTYGVQGQQVSQGVTDQAIQQLLGQGQVPTWNMPEAPDLQAFSVKPYEETEQGKQARADYQALMDKINSYPEFSYDPATDPTYQQYAESYARQGRQAMEDTLGQVSARTGGLASSYAEAAAQQQYQQYMAQLADKVPALKQLAYSMYMDEYNRALGLADRQYQMYAGDRDSYLDAARMDQDSWATKAQLDQSRWGTVANLAYNAYRDQISDNQWNQEFQLRQLQNEQDQARWQAQFDRGIYENDRDYGRRTYENDRDYGRSTYENDRDYGRSTYENDRNFDYGKSIDERDYEYQKEQDAWNRQFQERQYTDAIQSDAYDMLMQLASAGGTPSQTLLDRAGMTLQGFNEMKKWAQNQFWAMHG